MAKERQVVEAVRKALKEHPEGLTMLRIAELAGVHRHTVTKYVYMMVGSGEIYQRELGPAKLCYLKEVFDHPRGVLERMERSLK